MHDRSPDHLQQKCLDRASAITLSYRCGQCGEPCEKERTQSCCYCEMRFCPHCRVRDSDPITGETVDMCTEHAEKVQEIWDALRVRGGEQ